MRIGIIPNLQRSAGGLAQYGFTLLHAATTLSILRRDPDFLVFLRAADVTAFRAAEGVQLSSVLLEPPGPGRLLDRMRAHLGEQRVWQATRRLQHRRASTDHSDLAPSRSQPVLAKWLRSHRVEWVLYTAPSALSFEVGLPYVMPIHDLQHWLQPAFPEVSVNGEWERREYLFRHSTRHATFILVDSEVGKEDLLECYGRYGLTADRVKILPFVPSVQLTIEVSEAQRERVRAAYRIPERFLLYPAQWWPHKNHARVIEVLGLLRRSGQIVDVVFCGSWRGAIRQRHFHQMMALARRHGVLRQIHCLGYVSDKDLSALYAQAVGLVMPTFFGPTNLPILEAWAFGCPVLTSDIRGIREQVGEAGVLVNPLSVEALAEGMRRLWEDAPLRASLAAHGRVRLARYSFDDFTQRLGEIIHETTERVQGARQGAEAPVTRGRATPRPPPPRRRQGLSASCQARRRCVT